MKPGHKEQESFSLHIILQKNIVQLMRLYYKPEPQKTTINITRLATIN